jgi:hypothetical protein
MVRPYSSGDAKLHNQAMIDSTSSPDPDFHGFVKSAQSTAHSVVSWYCSARLSNFEEELIDLR